MQKIQSFSLYKLKKNLLENNTFFNKLILFLIQLYLFINSLQKDYLVRYGILEYSDQ